MTLMLSIDLLEPVDRPWFEWAQKGAAASGDALYRPFEQVASAPSFERGEESAANVPMIEHVFAQAVMRVLMARSSCPPGQLQYSRRFKLFSLAMSVLSAAFVVVLALAVDPPKTSEDWVAVAGLVALGPSVGLWMVIESWRVRHRFSADRIAFKSPWSRGRFAPWTEVEGLRWRKALKWLEIGIHGGRVMRFSPLLQGLDEFAQTALERLPRQVLQSSPTEETVLRLMARNEVAPLVLTPTSPEMLLAALPPPVVAAPLDNDWR